MNAPEFFCFRCFYNLYKIENSVFVNIKINIFVPVETEIIALGSVI